MGTGEYTKQFMDAGVVEIQGPPGIVSVFGTMAADCSNAAPVATSKIDGIKI